MRRSLTRPVIPAALAVLMLAVACRDTSPPPAPPTVPGPPAISDAQPVVDAPLFVGQNAFAAPLARQADYAPVQATARADGGNSGVVDGPAPLGRAVVTGSAALSLLPPLLWGRGGLTAGCQVEVDPGLTKACLAAVDASTLVVTARWLPPGQDLNLSSAVVDDSGRIVVGSRQRHLFVLSRPDAGGSSFRVLRDIDLNGQLAAGQGLSATALDTSGNLWFASGGVPPTGPAATDTTIGFVTTDDQVATTTLSEQVVQTGLAVDQASVYLATAPAGTSDPAGAAGAAGAGGAQGQVYDFTAAGGLVQLVWRDSYDAGSAVPPGGTTRGTGSPVVLLGTQYLAITDDADAQSHLLVYLRGALPAPTHDTTTTGTGTPTTAPGGGTPTTAPGGGTPTTTSSAPTTPTTAAPSAGATPPTPATAATLSDPRLVCRVALFKPGASAVTAAPIGYSSGDTSSVIVANGYNAPPSLTGPSDGGPANNMNQMATGVTRIDIRSDGGGCQAQWTAELRLKTAPVLSSANGLIYGYTQDAARAAAGSYVWYFVAVDYRSGRIVWRQRAGAGSTKNDNRQPTVLGANGVLYQSLPLGLVWMRDVAQHP